MRLPASLQNWRRPDRHSRAYLFGRRMRLSTLGLIVAFIALYWVYENFEPPVHTAPDPAQQVVPPGFVPDPNYTWVPRTNVAPRQPEVTTTTPTTTTTTTTTPPETTTATTTAEPTPSTTPGPLGPVVPFGPTTTVIDPDGPGPLSPQTFTQAPPVPPTTVTAPAPTPTAPPPLP
ncbi:hypothetical protein JN086_09450 [Mycolicibacterium austroafricanum]|uniref:Proline rich protein n=2 Tax=Mycolicibacterium TaxID=1866885 RepID=A0ABT8HCN5_MYCAO|nr:hypothetical protein [Mycolicibacterium austroafricanum]MDN4518512.1 hypothetical protein [Mycolicibacterium austroafricanum]PQP48793.1 hypothetical protein C6A88_13265 [Mycolicibacterium austroafricanum]QRZ08544.1 hypothetical protein JN090_08510 [Mycolicibacterium austroafricanum]QZT70194.1 hypothetical protein JN086_09450 [Mycolicibacterium austroafricanum]